MTDTQVQKQLKRETKKGERGTSAPVTSVDRHRSTKEVQEGQCTQRERDGVQLGKDAKIKGESASAPVTSADRHTSTKKDSEQCESSEPQSTEKEKTLSLSQSVTIRDEIKW